ncbi:MAG: FHA domain-containing protein [Butyrivibrio sp.]|nr:FHA domain-containing protein [Butyrivibrio sp.]
MKFIYYVMELPTVSFGGNDTVSESAGNTGGAVKASGIPWNIIAIVLAVLLIAAIAVFVIYNIFFKDKKRAGFNMKRAEQNHYYLELTNVESGKKYKAVFDDKVTIGRMSGDIAIDDGMISHEHCLIRRKGELMYIKDLNSKNGTYYDGSRVFDETPVISGGYMQAGSARYKIRLIKPEK